MVGKGPVALTEAGLIAFLEVVFLDGNWRSEMVLVLTSTLRIGMGEQGMKRTCGNKQAGQGRCKTEICRPAL